MDPFELEAMVDSLFVLASRIRRSSVPADSAQSGRSDRPLAVWMSLPSRSDISDAVAASSIEVASALGV
jgi:hypothetical protein